MYAVVATGGKQYRVEAGSELLVERVAGDAGSSITFDRVLLIGDGDAVTVGTPTVDGASVSGTVIGDAKGPKLVIFKFKQKVKYRRHTGHRQHLTRVRIDDISTGSRAKAQRAESETAPEAAEAEAPEKPKRTRKPAAKLASAPKSASTKADTAEKPKAAPRRRTTKKAESED
ncbi:MAG TPA: 50S ribosomal protein L21 [Candidatus Limnocylindria bacterium]|nr:50S ribosomal protein L21 [Candidatus Limnocylindria bacterium]